MNDSQANVTEFTVSELSAALKRTVEDSYGYVRVRGEISGYKGPHGSAIAISRSRTSAPRSTA
jgi:exodeoxyribonuclease VII large subunit